MDKPQIRSTFQWDSDLHFEFKKITAENRTSMTQVLIEAIKEYIKKHQK